MNADGGYTRSFRRKWDNPVFRNKAEAGVWAWMCDTAQWCDRHLVTRFGKIDLQRGELLVAERELAEDFNLNRNALRSLLQRMTEAGMIDMVRDRGPQRAGTVVRLLNYDGYQGTVVDLTTATANQPQTGPQTNHKPTANGSGIPDAYQHVGVDFSDSQDRKQTANWTANETEKDQEQVSKLTEVKTGEVTSGCEDSPPACAHACEGDTHTGAPPDFVKATNIVPFTPPRSPEVLPLPDDWVLSKAWFDWATGEGHPDPEAAAARFHTHWLGKRDRGDRDAANSEAVWLKHWQGWVRGDIKREQGHGQQRHGGGQRQKPRGGLAAYIFAQGRRVPGDAEGDPDDRGRGFVRG
jgi:hypothetical protein